MAVIPLYFFLVLTLLPMASANADDWTTADTWRETGWQVLNIIDWGQTLYIQDNDVYWEGNPFLGKNPTEKEIHAYFILGGIGHYGISKWLSPKNRGVWQYITIGFGVGTVWHNYQIGIRVDI